MHTFICSPFLIFFIPLALCARTRIIIANFLILPTTKGEKEVKTKTNVCLEMAFCFLAYTINDLFSYSWTNKGKFPLARCCAFLKGTLIISNNYWVRTMERQCSFVLNTPTKENCIKLLSMMMFKISPAIIMNSVNLCETPEHLKININREGKRYWSWLPSGNVVELI